jgi:hypothetical protein
MKPVKQPRYPLYTYENLQFTLCFSLLAHGRVWSSRISHNSPKLVPHTLPDVAEMQRLVHDLPLRSADAQRLRNSLYPDGSLPDGLYLRVLQVCTSSL